MPKIKIDVVVPADLARAAVDAIAQAAGTGRVGEGRIFVSAVDSVVRISHGGKR